MASRCVRKMKNNHKENPHLERGKWSLAATGAQEIWKLAVLSDLQAETPPGHKYVTNSWLNSFWLIRLDEEVQ